MANIAVALHVGSVKPLEELLVNIENISKAGYYFDLYVNIVDGLGIENEATEMVQKKFPHAVLFVSENRGMDIGGFFHTLPFLFAKPYRWILKLHTKTSASWRKQLVEPLCGSPNQVFQCLNLLEQGNGMLGSAKHKYFESKGLKPNNHYISYLAEKFKMPVRDFWFIGGTMFWVDNKFLRQVFEGKDLPLLISEMNTPTTLDPHWYMVNYKDPDVRSVEAAVLHYNTQGESLGRCRNCLEARIKKQKPCLADGMLEHAYERFFALALKVTGRKILGV